MAYEAKYGRPLRQDVKAECSGNYQRLALAWLTLPDALEQPAAPVSLGLGLGLRLGLGRARARARARGRRILDRGAVTPTR